MTPLDPLSSLDSPRVAVALGLARLAQKMALGALGFAIDLPRVVVERIPSLFCLLVVLGTPVAWAGMALRTANPDVGLAGLNATQALWSEAFGSLARAAEHSGRSGTARALAMISDWANWSGFQAVQPIALSLVWGPVLALAVALWIKAVRTRVAAGGFAFPFATVPEIEATATAWELPEVLAPKMSPSGPRAAFGRWASLGKTIGPILAGDLVLLSGNLVSMLLQTAVVLALGVPFMIFMAGAMAALSSLVGNHTSGSQGTEGAGRWILIGFAGLCVEFLAVFFYVAWRRKKKLAAQLALAGQPAMSSAAFLVAPWRAMQTSAAQKLAALGEADLAAREAKILAREVARAKKLSGAEMGETVRETETTARKNAASAPPRRL